jgi:hypothetical protein
MAAKSRTAKFYAANPASRKRKNDYQKEFNKKPDQVKKRVELNAYNKRQTKLGNNRVGDGRDASHKGKKIVGYSLASRNRSDSNNTQGDKNARSPKRRK